jgi:hypothetical protein
MGARTAACAPFAAGRGVAMVPGASAAPTDGRRRRARSGLDGVAPGENIHRDAEHLDESAGGLVNIH